jgi:hypothetical protein
MSLSRYKVGRRSRYPPLGSKGAQGFAKQKLLDVLSVVLAISMIIDWTTNQTDVQTQL